MGEKDVINFLKSLRIFGSLYFFSFPVLVQLSAFIPEYRRHPFVTFLSILSQSTALLAMMSMFTGKSFYSKISTTGGDPKKDKKIRRPLPNSAKKADVAFEKKAAAPRKRISRPRKK